MYGFYTKLRIRNIRCKDITGGIHVLPCVVNVRHSAYTYEIHSLSKRYLCVSHTEFYSIENKIAKYEYVATFLLPDKKNIALTANVQKKNSKLFNVIVYLKFIGPCIILIVE